MMLIENLESRVLMSVGGLTAWFRHGWANRHADRTKQ